MRSVWSDSIADSALKGRKAIIFRTFSAELTFVFFQTFHVWLVSLGGFAATRSCFDTASEGRGNVDSPRRGSRKASVERNESAGTRGGERQTYEAVARRA